MTILVTGAGGTVGAYFRNLPGKLELADHKALDITDFEAVRNKLSAHAYSWVVNLAAATDLDRAEQDPEWAYRLNVVGPENLAWAASQTGARMLHVSTVGIFCGDGREGPFTELDEPSPVNVYAKTKLAGERCVRRILPSATVVRTAWVMGGAAADKKFVGKVRDRLLAGEPVKAVGDIVGSPTYAKDLAETILGLIQRQAFGLFHATNQGAASRYDMVVEMKRLLGSSSELTKVGADAFPLPAPRPKSEVSKSLALPARGLSPMRTWQEALADYLRAW